MFGCIFYLGSILYMKLMQEMKRSRIFITTISYIIWTTSLIMCSLVGSFNLEAVVSDANRPTLCFECVWCWGQTQEAVCHALKSHNIPLAHSHWLLLALSSSLLAVIEQPEIETHTYAISHTNTWPNLSDNCAFLLFSDRYTPYCQGDFLNQHLRTLKEISLPLNKWKAWVILWHTHTRLYTCEDIHWRIAFPIL